LKDVMEFEGYFEPASAEFHALEAKLKPDLDRDLTRFHDEIKRFIETEIVQRYYYKKGVLINELQQDEALKKAVEVLTDKSLYESTLKPSPTKALAKKDKQPSV
ncbi:MAG TPA: peptidase S41, partial [Porphyromonadaceae bacterium]|nr:peptidase S41 [Porphyromonadaceae bacterium]